MQHQYSNTASYYELFSHSQQRPSQPRHGHRLLVQYARRIPESSAKILLSLPVTEFCGSSVSSSTGLSLLGISDLQEEGEGNIDA